MYLTDSQLTSVRKRPHLTRLWLSIFRPRVVLETQINQAGIDKSDRDITVSILSGEMLDVQSGMTVYIGTSQGAKDLGRIRLRSGSGSTLVLAENSINWENGWYLTVVRYFEPWGVFPRIVLDDDNVPLFYKDWDIAYTDQNEVWDPVVCMGPDDAGFLDLGAIAPTGSFGVWYTSSGSFNPTFGADLSGATFGWHFEGGTPTGSTAAHPGMVTYTGVGNFLTALTITTAASKAFTGRRHIRVMARPEHAGSEKPTSAWGLGNLSGDRDSGGWAGDVWIREAANPEDITEGALVVIFSEDEEGGTEVTKIGANAEQRGHILFVGYILEDTISYDPETSVVDFNIGGTNARMSELTNYNVAVDDHKSNRITGEDTAPWTRMPYTSVDRGLIHYLQWHSTLLAVKDISVTTDGEGRALKGVDIARGSMWDSVSQYLGSAVGAKFVSDRQGKMWAEIEANWQPTGSSRQVWGHMQPVLSITRQDWRSEVDISRRSDSGRLAYLEMSGVAWSGATTGTFDAYLSGAPGFAADYFGNAERIGNLALDGLGQPGLNQLAGNAHADRNALYPEINVPLAGDYRFIDIAPQHRVQMTLVASDTFRRITMAGRPFIPQRITYEYLPDSQMVLMDMSAKDETYGGPGETIEIPVDPPYDHTILPDWDIDFPPIIPPDPDIPPVLPPPGPGEIIYLLTTNRLSRSLDFTSGRATGSTWENITPRWETSGPGGPGTPGGVTGSLRQFYLDPLDPLNTAYLMTSKAGTLDGPFVYKITNLNGPTGTQSYTPILTAEQYLDIQPSFRGTHAFTVSPLNTNIMYYLGTPDGGGPATILKTTDGGATWADGRGNMGGNTRENWTGLIMASEHSIDTVFTFVEFNRRLFWSNSFGASWTGPIKTASSHSLWHIPFNANGQDNIMYAAVSSGEMVVSDDKFTTSSDDIRPVFDGATWNIAVDGSVQVQPYNDSMETWHLNRLFIAGIFRRSNGNQQLFYATDGVLAGFNSWQPGFAFPNLGGSNLMRSFVWHQTNVDLMAVAVDGNSDGLYLSVDGGMSFSDGALSLDRWEAGEGLGNTGSPDNLGWNVICMRWAWLA